MTRAPATSSTPPTPPSPLSRRSPFPARNLLARVTWGFVQATLFRCSPRPAHAWRNAILRLFGARLHPTARVYPRARVWGPWNLTMGRHATIANDVDVYCMGGITIGDETVVSQYTYLCGATHDHTLRSRPLTPLPITIGARVWIAADVFVGPGTTIGDDTVVGARSSVFTDLPPMKICTGTPAKPVRDRTYRDDPEGPTGATPA